MKTYKDTIDYLFGFLPMFQRVGAAAYKADIHNTVELMRALGNPEKKFRSIHVAGTNGKGSSSHLIASILREKGLKVGLHTSPHRFQRKDKDRQPNVQRRVRYLFCEQAQRAHRENFAIVF